MSTTDTETSAELTAGQLLQQAREQRQLSVAEVALQLNLRVNLVKQIEADALDSSMLITFVRGYLRAYARLVKLPEQQVLQAFERQNGSGAGPAKPMRTFSNRTGHQATENRFMWLTYAIAFILVLMLVLWWWQTASPGADNALQQQPAVEAHSQLTAISEAGTPPAEENAVTDDLSESSTMLPDAAATVDADSEPAIVSQPESAAAATQPDRSSQLATEPSGSAGQDVITMNFQDNCWIDVLDADGNRIAYGTKDAGYQMTVSGKAPFVVTLGNPSVVRITLNNQPFDMSSLPDGRVAKFTLAEPD